MIAAARPAPHVLLVSHEASRSGAPKVAVEVAAALRDAGSEVTTVLRWDGPLRAEFEAASTRLIMEPWRHPRAALRNRSQDSRGATRLEELAAHRVLRKYRPDVVWANTVKAAAYVRPALALGIPVVLHVHELEPLASSTLARYRLTADYPETTLVGCSIATAENLARVANRPLGNVVVIPTAVDVEAIRHEAGAALSLERTGTPFVVVACARADHRKGTDVWVRAAAHLREIAPDLDVRFRWIGSPADEYRDLARSLGVDDMVEFTGEVARVAPLLADADVFTIPSRVDPSPLVVPEAMALGLPVIGAIAGGIPAQIGDAGVLVPADDPAALGDAVVELLRDPTRRAALGRASLDRVRATLDIAPFRGAVVATVERAVGVSADASGMLTYPAAVDPTDALHTVLLQAFERGDLAAARAGATTLPYRVDTITHAGVTLSVTDAHLDDVWSTGFRGRARRAAERTTAPFLQTLLARRAIAGSDTTMAMFESQGNALAMLRALHIPPFRRPGYVIISCWLVRDLQRIGRARKLLYRFAYRSVDRLVYFSENQADVIARELRVPRDRLRNVHFGVDDELFAPSGRPDEGFVLAVGRDAGRDWRTFLDAVRGLDTPVKLACRDGALAGLDVPDKVEVLGYVSRADYRDLLDRARVVVVASEPRDYPTGQSVTLEAMATARCCVVTDTVAMSEYVRDGETALLVPPHDAPALRASIARALEDRALRDRIGAAARADVEQKFTARAMWARIAEIAGEAATARRR